MGEGGAGGSPEGITILTGSAVVPPHRTIKNTAGDPGDPAKKEPGQGGESRPILGVSPPRPVPPSAPPSHPHPTAPILITRTPSLRSSILANPIKRRTFASSVVLSLGDRGTTVSSLGGVRLPRPLRRSLACSVFVSSRLTRFVSQFPVTLVVLGSVPSACLIALGSFPGLPSFASITRPALPIDSFEFSPNRPTHFPG